METVPSRANSPMLNMTRACTLPLRESQAPPPALNRLMPWHHVVGRQPGRIVMPPEVIATANAPSSPLYSQGVKAGPLVFVSGMAGIDPNTGTLVGDMIQDQVR